MSVMAGLPWLVAALFAAAGGTAVAVRAMRPELASAASAGFAVVLIVTALLANRRLWRLPADRITPVAAPVAGVRNAVLVALGYAWGAATLAATYLFSGIVWQHGLQYAAGMALIAIGIALYARALASPDAAMRQPRAQLAMLRLTILHAAAAAGGIAFLFSSGKLKSPKGDWPANIVFLVGGLTIFALSVMAALTQWRLSRRGL
jgi:hypothetical protein